MDLTPLGPAGLPQLSGERFVTDGSLETDLVHHHGRELPHFAAFPLIEDAEGRKLLRATTATTPRSPDELVPGSSSRRRPGGRTPTGVEGSATAPPISTEPTGLQWHSCTASESSTRARFPGCWSVASWGHGSPAGARARRSTLTRRLPITARRSGRSRRAARDIVSAHTLSEVGEAVGVVRSAREVGLPVAIAFTVEVDGLLATGATLAETVTLVDDLAPPDYFLVNCAHPDHIERAVSAPGPWRDRVIGLLSNASTESHAQLERAAELDEGDPQLLAVAHSRLEPLLPGLSVVGGCCGTDSRHVAALWGVS